MSLVILVAAALATPAVAEPSATPASIEQGCDPRSLQPMLSAPPARLPALMTELDRRIAATLAEERRLDAEPPRDWSGPMVWLLAAATGALAWLAGRSGRRRWAAVAVALVMLGAGLIQYAHLATVRRQGQQRRLGDCHLRLTETRGLLQHSQLARCVGDLDEADEDLLGWQARLKSGGAVTLDEVTRLHKEISHR